MERRRAGRSPIRRLTPVLVLILLGATAGAGFVYLYFSIAPESVEPVASEDLRASRCGTCHGLHDPSLLSKADWGRVMGKMETMLDRKFGVRYPREEWSALLRYYQDRSPERLPPLPPDPSGSPVRFVSGPLPMPDIMALGERPNIQNVNVTDLDGDGRLDIVVSDGLRQAIGWIHREGDAWKETVLARVPVAARTETTDWNGDGRKDLIVAVLGSPGPTEAPLGKVVLLTRTEEGVYESRVLVQGLGRVADARPADLDGDGDVDFIVAAFGHVVAGRVGWLEQQPGGEFRFETLSQGPGTIHVPPGDLDGDGDVDFVALHSQHREEVIAFVNEGKGDFEEHVLFKANSALFGSSGIELVDLDRDGDLDILYSNGDAFDLEEDVERSTFLRPYHGVRWLENQGHLKFESHELVRFYGAYRATAGDLDGDGDLDVVVASGVNDWGDPERRSLIWLENDGKQKFTPHAVASTPTHLATAALGDIDGDGRVDIVAGGLHLPTIPGRVGRVTWWKNSGAAEK